MISEVCPKCSTPRVAGTRYCRRCGEDLSAEYSGLVAHATRLKQNDRGWSSTLLRLLELDITWKALRGVVTLGIAVPFFMFMAFVGANLGLSTLIVVESVMMVFIYLGIRDLKEVGSGTRVPVAVDRGQKAATTRRHLESSKSADRLESSSGEPTTLRLEAPGRTEVEPTRDGETRRDHTS